MKIKATINEVVVANRMIRTMIKMGLTPDDMLRIIALSKKQFINLKKT